MKYETNERTKSHTFLNHKRGSGTIALLGILLGSGLAGALIGALIDSCKTKFVIETKNYKSIIDRCAKSNFRVDTDFDLDTTDSIQYKIDTAYGNRKAFREEYIKAYDSLLRINVPSSSDTLLLKITKLKCSRGNSVQPSSAIAPAAGGGAIIFAGGSPFKNFVYTVDFSIYDSHGERILSASQKETIDRKVEAIEPSEWRIILVNLQKNISELLRSKINSCSIEGESGQKNQVRYR